jgi:hypothetical protein
MTTKKNKTEEKISPVERDRRLQKWGWCRGIVHFWDRNGPIQRVGNVYRITLRCLTCDAQRITDIDTRGHLKHNHRYTNRPEDFSTPGHRVTRSDVRALVFIKGPKEE